MNQNRKSLWQRFKDWADHLNAVVEKGASKGLVRKRTGNAVLDKISDLWFNACQWLDKLDSRHAFKGKPYQAKAFRVRTKAEKEIANFLYDRGVQVEYEKELRFGPEKKEKKDEHISQPQVGQTRTGGSRFIVFHLPDFFWMDMENNRLSVPVNFCFFIQAQERGHR